MKIIIGSDHAGFVYKEKLKLWLEKLGHFVEDVGPYEFKPRDDYPVYTFQVAKKVAEKKHSYGIIIALSGIGETIAANKVKGIRAVSFFGRANKIFLEMSRVHDNTNVLCLGSKFVPFGEAKKGIKIWLETKFVEGKRHVRRLKEIQDFENKNWKGK